MKWAEVLMIRNDNNKVYPKGAALYFAWLSEQISQNVPIDEIVRKVIAANGAGFHNPASIYYQVEPDLLKTAENTA
mgnify:CR=1 FL=1